MIKCIIFDNNGTLVDSEYLCNLGLEIKLQELGVKECASDMMVKFRGDKLAKIIQALEKKHQITLDLNPASHIHNKPYNALLNNDIISFS